MTQAHKKNIMLIHGAWHGKWCWDKVVPFLEDKDYSVHTVDLPGHGGNLSYDIKDISMQTYVDSVVKTIEEHNLDNLILLGHSMGGAVITAVADCVPERIQSLIYLCAFVPQEDGSIFEEIEKTDCHTVKHELSVEPEKNEISLKLSPTVRELFYGLSPEEEVKTAMIKLTKQPFQPFVDPISYSSDTFERFNNIYIECTKDQAILLDDQRRMQTLLKAAHIITLESDHSPFFSMPEILVNAIDSIDTKKHLTFKAFIVH